MILSPNMKAFDLSQEPDAMREAYGKTPFGSGCLLARRLVEAGVTFIEIDLDGWDTHQDNFHAHHGAGRQARSAVRPIDRRLEAARPARFDA